MVTDVRLYTPREADKAIDVALCFYGKEQESPRLTLSEGFRNSLGLCIFLAMAKHGADPDAPIILDDVVVSLDRDHRSMVASLLEAEFSDRQVILLTHDREWFFELGRFLDRKRWILNRLLPWSDPETGIRFADHESDLASAKAKVLTDPEDAESNVRRIMDQELAEIAERLELPMPYLRGEDNDHRTAGQFIGRLRGKASKAFRVRDGEGNYAKNEAAVAALGEIEQPLQVWANRGTHTFSASPTEAAVLIARCEKALAAFVCPNCGTPVWFCKVGDAEVLECRCGGLRWKD
jgi:hypothetical protein